jgi:hypothetical protein
MIFILLMSLGASASISRTSKLILSSEFSSINPVSSLQVSDLKSKVPYKSYTPALKLVRDTCPPAALNPPTEIQTSDNAIYNSYKSPCRINSPCNKGLYCDYTSKMSKNEGICEKRVLTDCSYTKECIEGRICNGTVCIQEYSLKPFEYASNKLACESNILYQGKCMPSILSTTSQSELPKKCKTSHDCISLDQTTASECVYIETKGNYCKLHKSDDLYKQFYTAIQEEKPSEASWLLKRIINYPVHEFLN